MKVCKFLLDFDLDFLGLLRALETFTKDRINPTLISAFKEEYVCVFHICIYCIKWPSQDHFTFDLCVGSLGAGSEFLSLLFVLLWTTSTHTFGRLDSQVQICLGWLHQWQTHRPLERLERDAYAGRDQQSWHTSIEVPWMMMLWTRDCGDEALPLRWWIRNRLGWTYCRLYHTLKYRIVLELFLISHRKTTWWLEKYEMIDILMFSGHYHRTNMPLDRGIGEFFSPNDAHWLVS